MLSLYQMVTTNHCFYNQSTDQQQCNFALLCSFALCTYSFFSHTRSFLWQYLPFRLGLRVDPIFSRRRHGGKRFYPSHSSSRLPAHDFQSNKCPRLRPTNHLCWLQIVQLHQETQHYSTRWYYSSSSSSLVTKQQQQQRLSWPVFGIHTEWGTLIFHCHLLFSQGWY